MQRLMLFALLTFAILAAAPLQAQRLGGGFHAGGHGGHGPGFGGHGPGFGGRSGFFPHHPGYGRFGNYGVGFGVWGYPFWDEDESFDFYPEAAMNAPAPAPAPVVVIESRDRPPVPAPVPEAPKLIEVPQAKNPGPASKPDPPALFILTNGERLEARRYMLTADSLHVEIARRQRTISLGQLDLDATIAANRERGIDLKIPADRNEIFLGF